MIDRGEPYMIMEKTAVANPQKSFLVLPCKARREIKATAAKKVSTNAKRPKILVFSFFGAYTMKINTYMISIPAPVPLMVETKRLFFDTKGRPYLFNIYFMYKISNYKTIELDNSENMKQENHFGLLAAQLIQKKKKKGEFQKILWFIFFIFCYFISLQFKIEGTSRSRECFFEKK